MNTTEIIEDYIKWSNNKPFIQKNNYGSLWAKPTSEQFFKYLTSDEDRLKIAKDIASWDNKQQIDFADELWNTIAVVPYVWVPDRYDVQNLDDYKTFCEENPCCEDDLYFVKSRSMCSTFKKHFWSSVIIKLTEFLKKDDISFVSLEEYKKLELKYTDKNLDYWRTRCDLNNQEIKIKELEDKISNAKIARNICIIFTPWVIGLSCFLTWAITFNCRGTENVKAQETQQEFDITVQNPQNKDINLNINNE
jgi:hypothetical protein